MSYDPGMKRHVLSLFATGHPHETMTDMENCNYCGNKFIKGQKEFNRLAKTYPEKFIRKQDDPFTKEEENLGDMLTERLKYDKLYKEHLKKLAFGTPEEQVVERKRMKSGFYKRHCNYADNKIFL